MDNTLPPLKRIAAIHDLSGLGKCSLTVALPVLSLIHISEPTRRS